MASEPTDLIREATATIEDTSVFADPLSLVDLVRRLRDALEADREQLRLALIDQGNTEAALAEANATISRVRETCRKALAVKVAGSTEGEAAAAAIATCILRAIEGPAPEVSS